MDCQYHSDRPAERFCSGCKVPLCKQCSQALILGEAYCIQCAVLFFRKLDGISIDEGGIAGAIDQLETSTARRFFHHFLFNAFILIIVMIGVLL